MGYLVDRQCGEEVDGLVGRQCGGEIDGLLSG